MQDDISPQVDRYTAGSTKREFKQQHGLYIWM